jgi:hypothetical protein
MVQIFFMEWLQAETWRSLWPILRGVECGGMLRVPVFGWGRGTGMRCVGDAVVEVKVLENSESLSRRLLSVAGHLVMGMDKRAQSTKVTRPQRGFR